MLESKKDALWIPHQVGAEFHRHRLSVIDQQTRAFEEVSAALENAKSDLWKKLGKFRNHPSLKTSEVSNLFDDGIKNIAAALDSARAAHEREASEEAMDALLVLISDLYNGRVGDPFDEKRLNQLYVEGRKRYELETPPGFKDKSKPEPERYGDLILWLQLDEHGRVSQKPAIFVTDDQTDDWWYRVAGRVPNSVKEYFDAAGARVHLYTPDRFLDYARETVSDIKDASVEEAESLSAEAAQAQAGAWSPWLEAPALDGDPLPPDLVSALNALAVLDERIRDTKTLGEHAPEGGQLMLIRELIGERAELQAAIAAMLRGSPPVQSE